MSVSILAPYAGVLGLMLLVLSFRVVARRRSTGIGLGTGGDAELERRVRAHGNFVEYVPLTLLLLVLMERGGTPAWALHALGAALVVARLAQAVGLGGVLPLRVLGTVLTFAILAVAGLALIGQALAP